MKMLAGANHCLSKQLAEIKALASGLREFTESKASGFAGTMAPDGELHERMVAALAELRKMADSLRQLSDTLAERPNALLFGKGKPSGPQQEPEVRRKDQ